MVKWVFWKLQTSVYPSNIAPISTKLCQNAFQAIPNISFFDAENVGKKSIFYKTLNGRLPLKHSSDWPQTLPKRVSDDPQHFIFRRRKKKLAKFSDRKISFSQFLLGFWGARRVLTSKSASGAFFGFRCTYSEPYATKNWPKPVPDMAQSCSRKGGGGKWYIAEVFGPTVGGRGEI